MRLDNRTRPPTSGRTWPRRAGSTSRPAPYGDDDQGFYCGSRDGRRRWRRRDMRSRRLQRALVGAGARIHRLAENRLGLGVIGIAAKIVLCALQLLISVGERILDLGAEIRHRVERLARVNRRLPSILVAEHLRRHGTQLEVQM